MYIKYIVNCWSVCFYHDIHSKTKLIYFEQGFVARGGFVVCGFCVYPDTAWQVHAKTPASGECPATVRTQAVEEYNLMTWYQPTTGGRTKIYCLEAIVNKRTQHATPAGTEGRSHSVAGERTCWVSECDARVSDASLSDAIV